MTIQSGSSAPWPSVSVVIPTLNEARNLPHVFGLIPDGIHEVIVVDGHSVDGTLRVARQLRPDTRIVRQTRKGKGNALACGFAAATGDIIAMVDADGSADPREIPRFVAALVEGADFAKGTRYALGGGSADLTRLRSFGNRVLSMFANVAYGTHHSDLCYGYNAFWRRHVPVFGLDAISPAPEDGDGRLWGDGFEVETLIHVRAAKAGLMVVEVPSFEHSRIYGDSNLSTFRDGMRVLKTILTERHHARRGDTGRPGSGSGPGRSARRGRAGAGGRAGPPAEVAMAAAPVRAPGSRQRSGSSAAPAQACLGVPWQAGSAPAHGRSLRAAGGHRPGRRPA